MTISLTYFYWILGIILSVVAGIIFFDKDHPRRFTTSGFWFLYAVTFVFGDNLSPFLVGAAVIIMAVLAGSGRVRSGTAKTLPLAIRKANAIRLGNKLFVPALAIPFITATGSVLGGRLTFHGVPVLEPRNVTLISFSFACITAAVIAGGMTSTSSKQSMHETRRLIEALGWAAVLPQLLGMLGLVFSDSGVGNAVAHLTANYINFNYRFIAVTVYCLGMAVFSMIMGNGFAAFPVVTGGVGIPVLLNTYHGDPTIMAAIGMFSGYCGTLLTPMAANFNVVPTALLELRDKNAVIKIQALTAVCALIINIILLNFLMFL